MKKPTAFLLFLLLIITVAGGCSGEGEPVSGKTDDFTELTESGREMPELPEVSYGGYGFRILSPNSAAMGNSAETGAHFWSDFGYNEERSGEPVNDAVFARNMRIGERYDIEILLEETADVRAAAQKSITAGDNLYDVVMPSIDASFVMAQAGHITDLNDVPWLNLGKPWWDGELTEALSLCNRIYVASGDMSMEDEEYNWCIIFNKSMITDYNLSNPYDAVISGGWTFDLMRQMGRTVTSDLNGDGVYDHTDSYGYGDDYSGGESWHSSAGEKIAELDPDGVPRLVIGGERSTQVMDKVIEIYNDRDFIIWVSEMKGIQNGWAELTDMLIAGRLLFRSANIYNIKQLRAMTDDFGLLPAPKYDAEQEEYSMMVFTHACAGICVPVTNADPERTGILLEALSCESAPVADAYYNVTLTGKLTRDEESLRMLEIIFRSRTYDIGKVFGWGKLTDVINNTVRAGSSFASKFAAASDAAETEMRTSYTTFSDSVTQK